MGNSEGTRVRNKLIISNDEVLGTTLGVADRSKLGDYEVSGKLLSGGSCEVVIYYNLEDRSEYLKDSAF